MLILGIETATEQVSVALGGHEGVIGLFEVARGRRHAEILTPAIEFVCAQADIGLDEIGLIAVDVGPGLFTGMRVGLAAAKALAQALRVPMIGISSLDLLAFPHRRSDRVVVPVIDARKGEVFYAMYRQVPGGLQQVVAPQVGPIDDLVADLLARSQEALCVGDGALRYRAEILDGLPLRDLRRCPPVGRSAGAAGPRPGAARGVGRRRRTSARCTSANPTPRSTGPARASATPSTPTAAVNATVSQIRTLYQSDSFCRPGTRSRRTCGVSVLARFLDRPARGRRRSRRCATATSPTCWPSRRRRTRSRGAPGCSTTSSTRPATAPHVPRRPPGTDGRRLRRADVRRRRGPRDQHRRPARASPPRHRHAPARRTGPRRDPSRQHGLDARGAGQQHAARRSCTARSGSCPPACGPATTKGPRTPS